MTSKEDDTSPSGGRKTMSESIRRIWRRWSSMLIHMPPDRSWTSSKSSANSQPKQRRRFIKKRLMTSPISSKGWKKTKLSRIVSWGSDQRITIFLERMISTTGMMTISTVKGILSNSHKRSHPNMSLPRKKRFRSHVTTKRPLWPSQKSLLGESPWGSIYRKRLPSSKRVICPRTRTGL